MNEVVKFPINTPVEVTLQDETGKRVEGRYGEQVRLGNRGSPKASAISTSPASAKSPARFAPPTTRHHRRSRNFGALRHAPHRRVYQSWKARVITMSGSGNRACECLSYRLLLSRFLSRSADR
jgi:hypothetical protein